jgi:hypothetical protein
MIVVYASDDNCHTIRVLPILNELFNYRIEMVTVVPESVVRSGITKFKYRRLTVRNQSTDPGCIQCTPFTVDIPGTVSSWNHTFATEKDRVDREVRRLRSQNVRLIISDISYFGQIVAEQLRIPSICVASYDWPFIFRAFRSDDPDLASIIDRLSQISSRFDYCVIPGVQCDSLTIGKECLSFDWVSWKPRMSRTSVRDRLKLSIYQAAVLLNLGIDSVKQISDKIWNLFHEIDFFLIVPKDRLWTPTSVNLNLLAGEEWSKFHVDIVNAVDIVFGKLEYVSVSEALNCKTRFIAVEAIASPECAMLRKALVPVVPYREITYNQFVAGDWYCINELLDVERRPDKFQECRTAGEVEIARWIRRLLGDSEPKYYDPRPVVRVLPYFIAIFAILLYLLKR